MHDLDEDHLHSEAEEESHPLWRSDRIELRSVGIDIGSSTSHLIFSTLVMRRQSAILSSRFELVERRIDYASPILLTPFLHGVSLDTAELSNFIQTAYQEAGFVKNDVATGAVITTGDAARKDNAERVVQMFSEQAGEFVCASAGPLLEAKMAAYGSGAVARSRHADKELTVLNIDIGGGTSKLAICRGAKVIEATALNVGARLITFDRNQILTRIETAAEVVARHRGLKLKLGQFVSEQVRRDLASSLVDALLEVTSRVRLSPLARELLIAGSIEYQEDIDVVFFSGGVSEYYYQLDVPRFGDLGPLIARFLRQRFHAALPGAKVEAPLQKIRATVIGASQFTAQVSGNTLYVSNPDLLPLRNLQVVPIDAAQIEVTPAGVASAVQNSFRAHEVDEGRPFALSVRWPHGPAYSNLNALATGIADATTPHRSRGLPIIIVIDLDIARLTGSLLSKRMGGYRDLVCIDGIDLHEFDYIDLSEIHPDSKVVTVIVKSLVFTG